MRKWFQSPQLTCGEPGDPQAPSRSPTGDRNAVARLRRRAHSAHRAAPARVTSPPHPDALAAPPSFLETRQETWSSSVPSLSGVSPTLSMRLYRLRLTGKQGVVASSRRERILSGPPDGVGARSDIQDI